MASDAASKDIAPDESREAKRLTILSTAARIFNERGFHNTSMSDVADALGVSKPFLYYYLKDKEDILFECSRIATGQLHAILDDVRKAKVNGWQRLELVFRAYAEVMTTDFGICLIKNIAPGSLPSKSRSEPRTNAAMPPTPRTPKLVTKISAISIATPSNNSSRPVEVIGST